MHSICLPMAFAMIVLTCIVVTNWYGFHCSRRWVRVHGSLCVCVCECVRLFGSSISGSDINALASANNNEMKKGRMKKMY